MRGWAVFAQAAPTIEDPIVAVGSGDYATAKAELSRASRDSGDAVLIGRVKGLIAEREQLANGLVAPDIVGVDLDVPGGADLIQLGHVGLDADICASRAQ